MPLKPEQFRKPAHVVLQSGATKPIKSVRATPKRRAKGS
jgi:hypothetical protein